MPSLRRTISSPSVRSSPYPSALFTTSAGARNQPSGHRRSSASETQTRRVLADIEWWKVVDGQQDVENGSAQDPEETAQGHGHGHDPEHPDVQDQVSDELWGFAGSSSEDAGVERPSTPLALTHFPPGSLEASSIFPIEQMAALSIAPFTPTRRRHTIESSSSSLESTPEAPEVPSEELQLDMTELAFSHEDFPVSGRNRRGPLPPFLTIRARSFADLLSSHSETTRHFADFAVSPLSASASFLN